MQNYAKQCFAIAQINAKVFDKAGEGVYTGE